ncbi:CRISPR-associated helicase Cas3' [Actinokineospora sp.]|uniref:CRISPR-associated helicase Cas3' n=1 Tax=Actinokineospora sp. TaxID=1872133 RepID=UPI004037E119
MPHEDAWLTVWAKSDRDEHNVCTDWLPLHQHLDDTAAVAGRLVDLWVSPQVITRIARELPDGATGVRALACWLAAVHDVGKASPAFAVQVEKLADHMRPFGLNANPRLTNDRKRSQVNHALVGNVAVRDWLTDERGFDFRGSAAQLGSIVGSHHGMSPEDARLAEVEGRGDLAGGGPWAVVRNHLLARATARIGGLEPYRAIDLSKPSQALLTAIVIVADWIASNSDLFPLRPISTLSDPPSQPDDALTERRLAEGWSRLNLPPRWRAQPLGRDLDEVFRDRFRRPGGTARPVQIAAVEAARAQSEPGMVVIEAPMGSGKTEAALLAAEVLAHASGANGCFVALPTQATTDAMFARVRAWLDALPGRADGSAVTLGLAHGKAHLNDEYSGLVHKGRFVSVGENGAATAHHWLSGRKKAGLASFVVGTIDQVLFAGLKSRHLMLRHLALAGKVVIIDEVHAYDVYMSQYLHRVLHWLGAYRVPVVLLSATLPDARRAELLRAYDSGRGGAGSALPQEHPGYPVVCGSGGVVSRPVALPPGGTTVRLDRLTDDLDTLVSYLRANLADGGCAVVVRNTVTRVQETALRLGAEFGEGNVTINHSRFLACDRAGKDRDLVGRFGPPESNPDRPDRHIVVASQVVEQSLDIDFDLMVTDLAPVDLVLQRVGRLHRHDRGRPERVRQARCAVVGVADWLGEPVTSVPGSRRVYGDHLLLRAAALLSERDTLSIPHDIAPLVQRAYGGEQVGPPQWQMSMAEAEKAATASALRRTNAASVYLLGDALSAGTLVNWLYAGVGDADDDNAKGMAQVRDGEESLEVLVVQRDADGGLLTPDWVKGGGEQIPLDQSVSRGQARVIAACSLRLPLALCHGGVIDPVIRELELNKIPSFELTPPLKGQLVLVLDSDRRAELYGYRLTYDLRRGLIHDRI